MRMNLKKELVFGLIGLVGVVGAVVWFAGQYKKSANTSMEPATAAQQAMSPTQANQMGTTPTSVTLSIAEVAKHSAPSDCWFIVSNKVYNVTSYINSHPGGAMRITSNCGKDATQAYVTQGGKGSHSRAAQAMLKTLYVGDLNATVHTQSTVTQPSQNSQAAPAQRGESEENENE